MVALLGRRKQPPAALRSFVLALGAGLCALTAPASGQITQTFAIDVDTAVDSRDPTYNFGVDTSIKVVVNGNDGSLARVLFELPGAAWSVPSADLLSAKVWFYTWKNLTAGRTVALLPLTRSFAEGTGDATASGDGATWQTCDGTSGWTTAGGDYDAGVSVDAAELAGAGLAGWFTWDIAALWDDANLRSHGAMLRMNDESDPGIGNMPRASFNSSDAGSNRPYVEVTYVPEPSSLAILSLLAGAAVLKRKHTRHIVRLRESEQ